MSVQAIFTIAVAATVLLGVAWRLLRGIHNGVNLIESHGQKIDDLGETVIAINSTLNNGLRQEVRTASEQAKKAQVLAGEAAKAAAIADQNATEGRDEIRRSVNALRGEVDIYTNVVLTDRARIKAALRELGHDIPDDD